MYIDNAIYKAVPTASLSFPIAEGSVVTAGGVTGIVTENLAQASPTAKIFVAIGGTIDLTSPANKDVTFTDEQIKALGSDFNFIPASEVPAPENELPPVTADDNGDVLSVVNGAWSKAPAPSSLPPYTSADKGKGLFLGEADAQTVNIVPQQTVVLSEDDIAAELTDYDFSGVSVGDTLTLTVDGHSETVTVMTGGGVDLAVAARYSVQGGQQTVRIGFVNGTGAGFDCLFRGTGGDIEMRKPGTYTVSLTVSVPSVEPKWEGNNIMTLPSQIRTTFLATVSALIQTAIAAADYQPRISSSETLTFNDEEEYDYVKEFIHRCATRGYGCLQYDEFLASVCLIDPSEDDERIWFMIPSFVQGTYNFLISIGLHLSLSDNKSYQLKIVIQQMISV